MYFLQALGGAVLRGSDGRPISLRSRKHLGLLLYLASHPRRPQHRLDLIRLFWDSNPSLARHSLSQALYDLRCNLSPIAFLGRTGILEMDSKGLLTLDTFELERAIKEVNSTAALDLCRGDFAPNLQTVGTTLFGRWLEAERARFRTLAQTALRQHLSKSEAQGQWSDVCLCALRLINLDRFDEQAHYSLMRSLWLQGDHHSALEHYQALDELFVHDLNRPLSERTRSLRRRMMRRPHQEPGEISPFERGSTAIPFVGREAEFDFLSRKVRGDLRGNGLLVVRGEAGIGKSRLLAELVRSCAVDSVRLLKSQCYAVEASIAYGPVFDAVPELRPGVEVHGGRRLHFEPAARASPLADEVDDQAACERRWLFEEVASNLQEKCRDGRLIWIIEDGHWLDAASAALLHFILRRLHDQPFALIVSLRTGHDLADGAQSLLRSVKESNGTLLDLGPLEEQALMAISKIVLPDLTGSRFLRMAVGASGGNPLYLLELLRVAACQRERVELLELEDAVSKELQSCLSARVGALPRDAILVLEGVAVLEELASLASLPMVTGLPRVKVASILQELEAYSLLKETGSRLEFVHEVVRVFVYSRLGGPRRTALHMAAAEGLAAEGLAGSSTLAWHCAKGGDRNGAYNYAIQASKEAIESTAYIEAAKMAVLARDMASDEDTRVAALCLLARARFAAGLFGEAAQDLRELLGSPRFMAPERRVEAYLDLLRAEVESCAWKAARVSSTTLMGQVTRVENRESQVLLDLERLYEAIRLAVCLQDKTNAQRHYRALRERYGSAKEADLLSTQATATALLGQAFYATFLKSSTTALHLLRELRLDSLSELDCGRVHHVRGLIAARRGAWDEAQHTISMGIALAKRRNDVATTAALTNNLACLALEQGEWNATDNMCERSTTLYASISVDGLPLVPALLNRASSTFYQGNARAALRQYRDIEALYTFECEGTDVWQVDLYMSLGLILAQLGEHTAAKRYLAMITDRRESAPFIIQERFKYEWLRAYKCLIEGDQEKAESILATSADEERAKDAVSGAKLRWLASLVSGCQSKSNDTTPAKEELRRLRLGWFGAFSTRWLRLVMRTPQRSRQGL